MKLISGSSAEPPPISACVEANGKVTDLRQASQADPRIVDPDDCGYAQGIGRQIRTEGIKGILYPSVRHSGGQCLAALRTGLLKNCAHAAYLEYHWNGQGIDAVFEVPCLNLTGWREGRAASNASKASIDM